MGRLLVKVGDRVLTGQQLTASDHPMEVPVHASTSGIITAIEPHTVAHPSGLSETCIHIKPDGRDEWRPREPWPNFCDYDAVQLLDRLRTSGIAGLGGAGFPTYAKLSVAREKAEIVMVLDNGRSDSGPPSMPILPHPACLCFSMQERRELM